MTDLPIVAPPSEMNDENFVKHINGRHAADLADGIRLATYDTYMISLYRAFHAQIHDGKAGTGLKELPAHRHRRGRPEEHWQDGKPTEGNAQ